MKNTQYNSKNQIGYDYSSEYWVNQQTGEVRTNVEVQRMVYGHRRFLQVDTWQLFIMLSNVGKSTAKIAYYIMDNVNYKTNIFCGTYKEIGSALEMSDTSVIEGMAELKGRNFIRRYRNGRWMLNPSLAIGCSVEYFGQLKSTYVSLKFEQKKEQEGGNENAT